MSENSSHDGPESELSEGQIATKLINSGFASKHLTTTHEDFDKAPTINPAQFASYKSGKVIKIARPKK